MKQAGIWLDKRNAVIVQLDGKKETVRHVISEVDEGNIRGGSRSSSPHGPQEVVSEKHILEKRKQQLKKYYKTLITKVKSVDKLLIMGPAETKKAIFQEVLADHNLKDKQVFVENADNMTVPQIKAKVRDYFNQN